MTDSIENAELAVVTRSRYLSYAVSVITSRALPDVRDGLKPVQRRILYAMFHNLALTPDARHKKSAAVVGEVMAKYHPHGDQSIYDAMARMAQPFSLRYPLVDGQGNFGSVDGDNPAAMRYTEAKLSHIAVELLGELKKETVAYRPNYDGTLDEPVVIPAQVPNLLVNGSSGIAVGMATNVPPHNLREVVSALLQLIDAPETPLEKIVGRIVKGPDFPTGGEILNSREELLQVYRTGQGGIDLRGEYTIEEEARKRQIVITSVPYGPTKSSLIEEIGEHIRTGKVPQLVDVRDESTDEVRIVLELRRDADADAAMAWLYRKTALQTRVAVNLTALVPGPDGVLQPERLDLLRVLRLFLDFRLDVTGRRLRFDLAQLEKRIHILEGFAILFDGLDEAIKLIRASQDRADARARLIKRFKLSEEQTEAILETKLYRLAKLEIGAIRKELAEKRAAAAQIAKTLASPKSMWKLIRSELESIRDAYGDKRRSRVTGPVQQTQFTEENYIIAEDSVVIVTRDGWFKRQKSYTEVSAIRVREGDAAAWVLPGSTREAVVFFTDRGKAYTMRIADVPLTTGYGEPVQTKFGFADGERIVGVSVTDARSLPAIAQEALGALPEGEPKPPWFVALTRAGKAVRLSLDAYREPSTVAGRLFARLDPDVKDDAVTAVFVTDGTEIVSLATRQGRCLLFPVSEVNLLGGAGRGVQAIKLSDEDFVLGYCLVREKMDGIEVETNRGRTEVVRANKFSVSSRGGRGREIIRMGFLSRVLVKPVIVTWAPDKPGEPGAQGAGGNPGSAGNGDDGQGRLF